MRRLRLPLLAITAALVALILPASSLAASPCRGANLQPTRANVTKVRHATLCLLNRQRVRHGLHRLRSQRSLTRAAGKYAHLMVRENFFAHVSPGGSTMVQRIRHTNYLRSVHAWSLGENLAWGTGSSATPAAIVRAWMHSPGHRANILNGSFREIGIGLASGSPGHGPGATYATEFGRRS